MRYELVLWGANGAILHKQNAATLTEARVLARRIFRRFPEAVRVTVFDTSNSDAVAWTAPIDPVTPLPCTK